MRSEIVVPLIVHAFGGALISVWFWSRYPDTWTALLFVVVVAYLAGRSARR